MRRSLPALVVVLALVACTEPKRTAEHCLEPLALAPQRDLHFEGAATTWLARYGYLNYDRAHGPLRPRFSHHALVTGGTRLNEYSATVWLYDDANSARTGPLLGPLYIYGRVDPDTCSATVTGASAG